MKPLTLLPAVDVRAGQAVRLVKGDLANEQKYGSPLETALEFQKSGAEWIHLVDLDAAFGTGSNYELISKVIEYRGQGIATILVNSLVDTAKDVLEVEQLQLSVSTQNQASYGLYLRLGFTVYGTEIHAMKIGEAYVDEYLMTKFLA